MTQARIFEFSGKYIVEVLAENGGNGFLLDHIECEGLNFEMAEKRTQESPMGLKYDDVRPVKYQSVYPAVAVFRKGDATRRLEIQIRVEDGTVIARVIYNAEQWVNAMTEAGQNFENFKIEGDIDLTSYAKAGKLPMGLKINSLTGGSKSGGEKYTISSGNVSYSTSSPAESMFTAISGGIRNLRFANITLDNGTKAGTNFGLVASNQGPIDNCEFENIRLSGYQASQVGMIGSNSGSVTNIRLKNINVSTTASMNYIGGLIGYNTGTVKHVEAEGGAVKYTSMEDMPSGSLFRYQVTAASGSYVGGIIGMTRQLKTQRKLRVQLDPRLSYSVTLYENGKKKTNETLKGCTKDFSSEMKEGKLYTFMVTAVNSDGKKSKTVEGPGMVYTGNRFVSEDGKSDSGQTFSGAWIQEDGTGKWRYVTSARGVSYCKDQWKEIGGIWYRFDENSYMVTGWYQDPYGTWYYMDGSGAMVTGERTIDGTVYRFGNGSDGTAGAWIS